MAYPPRICVDGAVYHVMARGNNRAAIFLDDRDRNRFMCCTRDSLKRYRAILYAYVLMPNHFHWLIKPADGVTISRVMQSLSIAYTRYFNRRYARVGHVLQGRFRSRLIGDESYFLTVSRYIHLNPVKARLCVEPLGYYWSSYRAYVLGNDPWRLAAPTDILALLGGTAEQQRASYRDFCESPLISDIKAENSQNLSLISDID